MQSLIERKLIVKTPQLRAATAHYFVENLITEVQNNVVAYYEKNRQLFRAEAFFRIKASSPTPKEFVYQIAMSGVPRSCTLRHDVEKNTLTVLLKTRYLLRHDNLVADPRIDDTTTITLKVKGTISTTQSEEHNALCSKVTNWVAPKLKDKYEICSSSVVYYTKDIETYDSVPGSVYCAKITKYIDNPHDNGAVVVLERSNLLVADRDTSPVYQRLVALHNYRGALYLLTNKQDQSLVVRESELRKSFKSIDKTPEGETP